MSDSTKEAGEKAAKKARSRGISTTGQGGYSHHVLMCIGKSCCDGDDHRDAWKRLNKRLKALEKTGLYVYRTRVDCLNFCRAGPLLIVYPEGIWYHSVTTEVVDRIIEEHIRGEKAVNEYAFAHNPMKPG